MNNRAILRIVGKNISAKRNLAGITQECLAELVGIHWKTLGRIERGQFPFAVTSFIKIAQYLETDPAALLVGVETPDQTRTAEIKKALARKRDPKSRVENSA